MRNIFILIINIFILLTSCSKEIPEPTCNYVDYVSNRYDSNWKLLYIEVIPRWNYLCGKDRYRLDTPIITKQNCPPQLPGTDKQFWNEIVTYRKSN